MWFMQMLSVFFMVFVLTGSNLKCLIMAATCGFTLNVFPKVNLPEFDSHYLFRTLKLNFNFVY